METARRLKRQYEAQQSAPAGGTDLRAQAIAAARAGDMATARRLKRQYETHIAPDAISGAGGAVMTPDAISGSSAAVDPVLERFKEGLGSSEKDRAADLLGRGLTQGLSDELAYVGGAFESLMRGEGWSAAKKRGAQFRKLVLDRQQAFEAERPRAALALDLAGSMVGAGGLAGGARTAGRRFAAGAATGAFAGAARTEGNLKQRAAGAALGGALGGAASAALPAVASAVSRPVVRAVEKLGGSGRAGELAEQTLSQSVQPLFWPKVERQLRKSVRELSGADEEAFRRTIVTQIEKRIAQGDLSRVEVEGLKRAARMAYSGDAEKSKKAVETVSKLAVEGVKQERRAGMLRRAAQLAADFTVPAGVQRMGGAAMQRMTAPVSQATSRAWPSARVPTTLPPLVDDLLTRYGGVAGGQGGAQ